MYGVEWFSERYKPHMSNTVDNTETDGEDGGLKLPAVFEPVFYTAEEESRANLKYINTIRTEHGRSRIAFDERAYDLALARVHDTLEYDYRDHVNPHTGTCPYTMKGQYGFATHEHVAENLAWTEGIDHMGPNKATDLWMNSKGHRFNLLYAEHIGGATACDGGVCIFLGVNNDMFGAGCHTAAEGEAYWNEHPG